MSETRVRTEEEILRSELDLVKRDRDYWMAKCTEQANLVSLIGGLLVKIGAAIKEMRG